MHVSLEWAPGMSHPLCAESLNRAQAACYGRAFCPAEGFARKRILQKCRLLRLLNAVREPEVGMPMTMAQLTAQGAEAVVRRLVAAKRHLLALRVATALDLSPEQVRLPTAALRCARPADALELWERIAVLVLNCLPLEGTHPFDSIKCLKQRILMLAMVRWPCRPCKT